MAEDASDAAFLAELERESKEFNKVRPTRSVEKIKS